MKIDVKGIVNAWKEELKEALGGLDEKPTLRIIQVGDNAASNKYVAGKLKDAAEIGIYTDYVKLANVDSLFEVIDESNRSDVITGVIVQLPIEDDRYNKEELKEIEAQVALAITPEKDVDGFHPMSPYTPATALGIMRIVDSLSNPLSPPGVPALVIGRSKLVGLPTAMELLKRNYTITVAHSKSWKLKLKDYALVVCAVGNPRLLDRSELAAGTILIDVGTNVVDGKLVGDSYGENEYVAYTPVPGGVGLTTRMALLANTVEAAKKKKDTKDRQWVDRTLGL